MNPSEETRDWRSLPNDVILHITKSFNSLADFYSFRNTCPSWHVVAIPSAETLVSQSPLVLLSLETYEEISMDQAFIDISTKKLYKVPPFLSWGNRKLLNFNHGYLAMGEEDGRILVRHIFTREEIPLPRYTKPLETTNMIFSDKPSSPECIFLLFQPCEASFHFCKSGDQRWTGKRIGDWIIMNMAFLQGRLHALLTKHGSFGTQHLAIVDLFPDGKIDFFSRPRTFNDQSFMVSSGEELLLSAHGSYYRWNMEEKRWVPANSFGGRAIFISGSQFTASVDPATIYGIEPDFCYNYNADHDILSGSSIVNQRRWTMQIDFDDLSDDSVACSGRPVWVFPSQCF